MFLTDSRPDLTPNLLFFYKGAEEPEPSGESTKSKVCTSCKADIPQESEFCPKCGTKQ
jgi:ribosomal protein L40E